MTTGGTSLELNEPERLTDNEASPTLRWIRVRTRGRPVPVGHAGNDPVFRVSCLKLSFDLHACCHGD